MPWIFISLESQESLVTEARVFICSGYSRTVSKMVPVWTSAMSAESRSPSYPIIVAAVKLWGLPLSNGCIRVSYCGFGLTCSSWLITFGTFSYAYWTRISCSGPQPFWHNLLVEDNFSQTRVRDGGLGMIQVHCIYCALYFYYHYISFPSAHQAFDPRGWGPLYYRISRFFWKRLVCS